MLGCIALGGAVWAVKDTRPFAATSWWPSIFAGAGLFYAGLVPALINLNESAGLGAARFLALASIFHLLPLGLVLWYAMSVLPSTAYAFLVPWCIATLAVAAAMTLAGAAYRWWKRPREA